MQKTKTKVRKELSQLFYPSLSTDFMHLLLHIEPLCARALPFITKGI